MKRTIIGLLIGALLLAGMVFGRSTAPPAKADHINEPTAPVTSFELSALRYGTEVFVDCSGVELFTFNKVRLQPLISVAAAPSEHFDVTMKFERQVVSFKGTVSWVPVGQQVAWLHQNVSPHDQNITHHNIAYPTDIPQLTTGKWRSIVTLDTDVSDQHLSETCIINVA